MIQIGMPVEDVLSSLNYRHRATGMGWIRSRGFDVSEGRIIRLKTIAEVEDEIAARVASRPNPAPCWRCGARECGHR